MQIMVLKDGEATPAFIEDGSLALFAEEIAIVALRLCDPKGLLIAAHGDVSKLEDIALKALSEYTGYNVVRLTDASKFVTMEI